MYNVIYYNLMPYSIIAFFSFSFPTSVISTNGSLGTPQLKPIILQAALTGIGLTSENRLEVNSNVSSCNLVAFLVSPWKKYSVML